jgi:bifunctional N-acetylglutamate synthase/kinase
MKPSDLVVRFVQSVGRPGEADYYLSLFRAERPESFALICVSEAVMREASEALQVDLRFLSRLGLHPVVVFGLVDPSPAAAHAMAVREALSPDVPCEVAGGEGAAEIARAGRIPLVPMAVDGDVDTRFDRLASLVTRLRTRKVIFLGRRSGLQPIGHEPLSLVDLTTEYDELASEGVLPEKQGALLRQIRRLVAAVGHRLTVAVTSPLDLPRELFTVRGAGTLVRRGSQITRYDSLQDAGIERLRALIEAAFGRRLRDGFVDEPATAVYVADDFRGAAIIAATPLGAYLSKFAVDVGAQGEGIGRDLWRAVAREQPTLFWRSRSDNPISAWYQQRCEGMARAEPWTVFWRGVERSRIPAVIEWAERAPVDLSPGPTDDR